MAVRKQHNRRRTEPWGTDFADVMKRAKAFYKDGIFYIEKYEHIFCSFRLQPWEEEPKAAVRFEKSGRRWIQNKEGR